MNIDKISFGESAQAYNRANDKTDKTQHNNVENNVKDDLTGKLLVALGGLAAVGAAALLIRNGKTSKAAISGETAVKQANAAVNKVQEAQSTVLNAASKTTEELGEQAADKLSGSAESIIEPKGQTLADIPKDASIKGGNKPVKKQQESKTPIVSKDQTQQIKSKMLLEEFELAGGVINKSSNSQYSTAILKDGTPYSGTITQKFNTGVTSTEKYVNGALTKQVYNGYKDGGTYILEFNNEKLIRESVLQEKQKFGDDFPYPDFVKDMHRGAKTYQRIHISEYSPETGTYNGVVKIVYDNGSYDVLGETLADGSYSKIVFHNPQGKVLGSLENDFEQVATGIDIYPFKHDRLERYYDANHNLVSEQKFEDPEFKALLDEVSILQQISS